jgi:hypothetical protein
VSQIINRGSYDSLKINVGTDVFFTGLFTAYLGTKKITPIFRFGKVSLLPKEKIVFEGLERELILIESASFGGNSGSPVVFNFNIRDKNFVMIAGVISGGFSQGQVLGKSSSQDIIAWNSMGISAVTPSHFILEILNSVELESLRK